MAILVDDAIWSWKGRKWAHLISDSHVDELHDFAHHLGLPYLAFQGDHYDVHTDLRIRALDLGARSVAGRDIVVALREAGLRRRGPVLPWTWVWRQVAGQTSDLAEPLDADIVATVEQLAQTGPVEIGRAQRRDETLIVVSTDVQVHLERGLTVGDRSWVHRSSGERGTYVEWRRLAD